MENSRLTMTSYRESYEFHVKSTVIILPQNQYNDDVHASYAIPYMIVSNRA